MKDRKEYGGELTIKGFNYLDPNGHNTNNQADEETTRGVDGIENQG
jgi:hypothetical protein